MLIIDNCLKLKLSRIGSSTLNPKVPLQRYQDSNDSYGFPRVLDLIPKFP
jgi:hypothetical protein